MAKVLNAVNTRGHVRLSDLVDDLDSSPATVRRDLTELEANGLLVRTHGGAQARDYRAEVSVFLRDAEFCEQKRRIARYVSSIIPDGRRSVAIGGGSTTSAIARALAHRPALTIVTNSLTTAMELAAYNSVTVMMTGGLVRGRSLEVVGALPDVTFANIAIGTAILGADGVSARNGVTTYDEVEAATNHAMISHADQVIVVADGSKVGRATCAGVARLEEIDLLVTDRSADSGELAKIRESGVDIRFADS